ncbi:hypothetical protein CYMTET_24963 [Cymbomonas tetramitiformis]|uniref:Uncharacterized protein n=1 Tax=Cymbomonas tetramitiformis TaxID=36881 RepID=A0AAE0FW97_9CHLO|nr:hypothetical protein CYMTET_24963 [Cymbomonas tetramitiformis]
MSRGCSTRAARLWWRQECCSHGRSVAQTEVTGRVKLHAENLRDGCEPLERRDGKGKLDSATLVCGSHWLRSSTVCKLHEEPEELELEPGCVRVTFARCGEEKDVMETKLLWPDFTLVDQKVDKETKRASETWATRASWRKDSDPVVPPDCQVHRDAGRHTMAAVQESLSALQVYPTGVITGTLMWDKRERQFCVLSEVTRAHWELMEKLVLPFYYEVDQRWRYQPLKHVQRVDIANLRARLRIKYDEVLAGRQTAPLLVLSDLACKVEKFYPVTDGEGGQGEVFESNAAAQEYLHLGDGRMMLSACKSEDKVRESLDNCGTRRPPPAQTRKTVRRDGAGPSGHASLPAAALQPPRLRQQTWLNGPFDPETTRPHIFQGTYEAESDTDSVDAAVVSKWLDPAQVTDMLRKAAQTVFLIRYRRYKGEVLLHLGMCNKDRGKGVHTPTLSSKQMHRYSYSALQGQLNKYLPLGGQSAGCSGGLLGTIRKHVEDILDGEDLTALIRRHMDVGLQRGTLHVLMTRAAPRAKPVYYIFGAQELYAAHPVILFTPEYLGSSTRKFNQCSWVSWRLAALVHAAPLSAFTTRVAGGDSADRRAAHQAGADVHGRRGSTCGGIHSSTCCNARVDTWDIRDQFLPLVLRRR